MSEDHAGKSERVHRSGDKATRVRQQAEEPAKIKAIGPIRDRDLITGDETKRGADAMNGGTIAAVLAQIKSELFLNATAQRDHNVARPARSDPREERWIFDTCSVDRRDVAIVGRDRVS